MKKVSIEQVEPRLAQEIDEPLKAALKQLGYSIPKNSRLRVKFLSADGRKKRSNADAQTWAPESDPMKVWLESTSEEEALVAVTPEPEALAPREVPRDQEPRDVTSEIFVHPAEAELLRALDKAESTPGWSFVSLKKFRDEILPGAGLPSIRTDVERQSVLRSAIEKRLILKKPIPNPKSPQFPVTSIRLNRLLPEVQQVLGLKKRALGFRPIHIKGEPLSATILRERR